MGSNQIIGWMRISIYRAFSFKNTLSILAITIVCNLLYLHNKLLFHFLSESFTIVIGILILVIAMNVSEASENGFFIFLAIGFGYVSVFNLLHVINYEGINLLSKDSFNTSIQLGALSTYVQAISMAIAFKFIDRKVNWTKIVYLYTLGTIIMILIVYKSNIFSQIYLEGYGQTPLNHLINFSSALMFTFPIYLLYVHKDKIDFHKGDYTILTSMIFTVLSRILLVMYKDPNGYIAFLAHLSSVLSFYFLYKSVITSVLREPYKLLFKGLKDRTDELEEMNNELNAKNDQLESIKNSLEKSKDRYKDLVKSLPDSVVIRHGGEIVFVNDATLKLLKAEHREEVLGANVSSILSNKYIEEIGKNSTKVEDGGLCFLNLEIETLDHKTLDIEICEIETIFENKKYNLMVIRDISERKKLYELRIELNSKIEREKIRSEFFANLSHELRTPITVIYSALQLEDVYIKRNDIDGIEKYNNIIKQNCHRLLRMCNNLIDITKIDTGLFNPSMKCSNIVYLVENVVSSVLCYVESNGMNIVFDTNVEESYILCDQDLIERIILNLLSNAVKFGKKSGNIWVDVYDEANEVSITVRDDGIGIVESDQNNIFSKFSQVDNSLRREREGSGLGLSIVKSLVELHGGSILLKSELNVGSEFIITFLKSSCYKEEYAKDSEVTKYLTWKAHTEISETEKIVTEFYMDVPGIYAIELKSEQKCIGCIDLRLNTEHDKGSFGYVINRNYWNQGYMSEALNVILDFAFSKLKLNRVESTHYVGNEASGKVMQKCGMKYEGTSLQEVKVNDKFFDVAHYAILKENWT